MAKKISDVALQVLALAAEHTKPDGAYFYPTKSEYYCDLLGGEKVGLDSQTLTNIWNGLKRRGLVEHCGMAGSYDPTPRGKVTEDGLRYLCDHDDDVKRVAANLRKDRLAQEEKWRKLDDADE